VRWRLAWLLPLGLVLLALGALGAISGWHDLSRARNELLAARSALGTAAGDPQSLRTPAGRTQMRGQLDEALTRISTARRIVRRSPALTVARFVPVLVPERIGVDELVDDSQTGAETARSLLSDVDRLTSQTRLQEGLIPFAGMAELERAMRTAGERVRGLDRSSAWLVGPLHDARQNFDRIAHDSSSRLLNGAEALQAARSFLGLNGDRRYFVALQNNAEMRDQGMVLSYAVARVSGGRLVIEKTGSINTVSLKQPAPVQVPTGTSQVFGSLKPNQLWQSVNATADFGWSGQAMTRMFREATGQAVDGVIAVDVPGLVPLLRAVGPVRVSGVAQPITADNAVQMLLHDLYEQFPIEAETARQQRLAEVASGVIDRLHHGSYDLVSLGRDLAPQVGQGHLRLWSTTPAEQKAFEKLGISGGPALVDPSRTFHLAVENRTGAKLDYYVRPVVRQEVRLTKGGSAVVHTSVTVDNRAPVNGKPGYQLGPDEYHTTTHPGDYIAWVLLWGPSGSNQQGSLTESGLQLSQYVIPVAAGQKGEVGFDTVIPDAVRDGKLELRYVPQPRLEPADVTVTLVAPDWNVDGPGMKHFAWDSVKRVSWGVTH
jgi:hypothetical protein